MKQMMESIVEVVRAHYALDKSARDLVKMFDDVMKEHCDLHNPDVDFEGTTCNHNKNPMRHCCMAHCPLGEQTLVHTIR